MSKQFKTKGIIIRKVDLNEADRILTVLTHDQGKIHCIAKGARKLTSRFCGRLELLYEVEFDLYRGKSLESLREAELSDSHRPFSLNLANCGVLFYMAEITDKFMQDYHQVEGVYSLLSEALRYLQEDIESEVVLHSYLIKLFTLLGFMPPWDNCVRSNEKLNLEHPIYFSALDVGVLGYPHALSSDIRIPAPMVKWVNFMQKYPFAAIAKVNTTPGERMQVWAMLRAIIPNILTSPIKAEEFFETTNLSL